ncbi:MAG: NAD(P)/FAD-dependent oxidoreductase, partial [Deltaproteobacteria bacterium]
MPDAVVVGSGPNGLSAAIELARAGLRVHVHEAEPTIGGGTRSAELTLPGFLHDVCSAIHPMAAASPFFSQLRLAEHGLEWVHPEIELAHPLPDGTAVAVVRSVEETANGLGADAPAYRRVVAPLAARFQELLADALGPMLRLPRHPLLLGR